MSRIGRMVTTLVLGLVIILFSMVGLLRASRSAFSTPSELSHDMVEVMAGHVFVYAARVGDHVVVFDSGKDPAGNALRALLARLKAKPADVTDVFLTHGFADHVAGVSIVPQARVWAGEADVDMAAGLHAPEGLLARLGTWVLPTTPAKVTNALAGPAEIAVGDAGHVRALPLAAQSPGAYAYLFEGVLFIGDTVNLRDGKLMPPPATLDTHPQANRLAIQSLGTTLAHTNVDRVCTAHGGCTAAGQGRALLDDLINSLSA